MRVPLLTCPHKEVLCWSSPRRGGADKPLNVCIVLANELEQNGREYRRVGKETEREGAVAIVCSPNLVNGFEGTGRQTNVVL